MSRKTSPYGRKEWHRKHSGSKAVNQSVDVASRGAGTMARTKTPASTLEERQRANLTGKQLLIACVVGAVFPLMALSGADKIDGAYLVVLAFFFIIPFLVMVLIFKLFNVATRSKTKKESLDGQENATKE